MSKETNIFCDGCGQKMNVETTYPHHYGLKLSSVDTKVQKSGAVFSILMSPLIDEDKYFCGTACLDNWLNS